MKRKLSLICILFFLLLQFTNKLFAQKEFWGMTYYGPIIGLNYNYGTIYKTDSIGEHPSIVHAFDSINGSFPESSLFLGDNEKIYGVTSSGGLGQTSIFNGGILFEYDLAIDSFIVLEDFNTPQFQLRSPFASFTKNPNGNLYGISNTSIYGYNPFTQNITTVFNLPVIPSGISSVTNQNAGNLMLASDGMLYGATLYNSSNTNSNPFMGSIFSIDTLTNNFTIKHLFDPFNLADGKNPNGNLVEWSNGKLYGTTRNGGINDVGLSNGGVLFELDPITNSYIKKIDLDSTTGSYPYELIKASNNKLYGLTGSGGSDDYGNHFGTLIEYDPATNIILNKHNFGFHGVSQPYFTGNGVTGYLLQASNGKLYGTNQYGMFEYDYILDSMKITFAFSIDINISNAGQSLIEICRKPSYQYFSTDSFIICETHNFNYTVHSTNASNYQWNKNGVAIATQKDSILNFNNMQLSDSGIYTCIMQNQCGQTETMNLLIRVDVCTGINEQIGFVNAITIVPNPTNDYFQLHLIENSNIEIEQVAIKNMLGQIVLQHNSSDKTIDIKNLSQGFYMVEVRTNKGFWVGRVVKN